MYKKITLCLLKESDLESLLREVKTSDVEIGIHPAYGTLQVTFESDKSVDHLIQVVKDRFPTFFIGEESLEVALHREMIQRKKTLALAESCTGGSLAAKLIAIPGASEFFRGSIVAYTDAWKEHFLGVRHDTLEKKGAVSREAAQEMVEGLFAETDAEYAVATTGFLDKGSVFIAIARRNETIDIGHLKVPLDRGIGIEQSIQTALGALWRRLVHNTLTFS